MSENEKKSAGGGIPPDSPPPDPENDGRLRAAWHNPALRFVVVFLICLLTSYFGYPVFKERFGFIPNALMVWTSTITYFLMWPFTDGASVNGTTINLNGFAVSIVEECTGIYEALIFSSAVLAFPTIWQKRVIGIGLGVPMIYSFNLMRVVVLIVVGKYYPAAFDFMHLYFFQVSLIAIITTVWALWLFKVVMRDAPRPI